MNKMPDQGTQDNPGLSPSPLVQDLIQWAQAYGTSLHPDVEVFEDPHTGLSFRATADIPSSTRIAKSSYQTTLSYLNAIAPSSYFQNYDSVTFAPEFIEALEQDEPHIIGHFFLVQQFLMKEKSFWWPYIRLLPQPDELPRIGIPIWWPDSDRRFLDFTNVEPAIKKREEMWRVEWAKGIRLLGGIFEGWGGYTYLLYQWAATIFGSRSFRASLTIPEQLILKTQESSSERSLILDHIKHDRFSVLLPVLDIGNHNGVNKLKWIPYPPLPNLTEGHFSLLSTDTFTSGDQIYNYYGDKSNSELLLAYGFILPNPDNDQFNVKLMPFQQAIDLRRSQSCYSIRDPSQPEQEFLFQLRRANGTDIQSIKKMFSDGLLDTMVCLVANMWEIDFIMHNPDHCILEEVYSNPGYYIAEKVVPPAGILIRALMGALNLLYQKFGYELAKLETSGKYLGEPRNQNQRLGLDYRQRQVLILRQARFFISEYVQLATSFNSTCIHQRPRHIVCPAQYAQFLSLECAFAWLANKYPLELDPVVKFIAIEQDETLPLNWAILVEDWDITYWIVWVLLVYILWTWNKDKMDIASPDLSRWIRTLDGHFCALWKTPCPQITTLRADASEEVAINRTMEIILRLPGFDVWLGPLTEVRMKLRNFISHMVQEETVSLPYVMLHPPNEGRRVQQKLLYLKPRF